MKTEKTLNSWFDSPYYHILYKNRNDDEAAFFLNNIVRYLSPKPNSKFLDVACGKGRYAILLNEMEYEVTGIDISQANIMAASKYSNSSLHFYVHDMQKTFKINHFDFVINFFTSFGFFDSDDEHLQTLKIIASNLKPNGKLVLDFLNPDKVIKHLVSHETKTMEGINFHINRKVENGFITKEISFENHQKTYHFKERIKVINKDTFLNFFNSVKLQVECVFGNYRLAAYDSLHSDRMIFIARKCY